MSEWALKRFWTETGIKPSDDGFQILLDSRPVRTPAKRALVVPNAEMAQKIAGEWDSQKEQVNPQCMPWTRSANAAIDKVAVQRDDVMAHLAEYSESDLLCYRAERPAGLVQRQKEVWDPVLDWAATQFGLRLTAGTGVMPVAQSNDVPQHANAAMAQMSAFELTGFYDLVTLSGSFVLALAVTRNFAPADTIWGLSRVDEDWQISEWGHDDQEAEVIKIKRSAFLHAAEFYHSA